MDRTGFAIMCCSLIFSIKEFVSGWQCCYETLSNYSIAYNVKEAHEINCTPIWLEEDITVVDEDGNIYEKRVDWVEPQKLILKRNTDKGFRLVTYQKDCQLSGKIYSVTCKDPCSALSGNATNPVTHSNTTQRPDIDHRNKYIISWVTIAIGIIFFIIIITTFIWYRKNKNKSQASNVQCRCIWRAVPNDGTQPVLVVHST